MGLKVLFVSAEVAPLAKVGGLADVAASLPRALKQLGHDVRVIMPAYGNMMPGSFNIFPLIEAFHIDFAATTLMPGIEATHLADDVPVYLIRQPELFARERVYGYDDDAERFIFLSRAVPEVLRLVGWLPDVVHVHDWHTALVPEMLGQDALFDRTAAIFTIHNLAYQGHFSQAISHLTGLPHESEPHNFMARGILHSDAVTTVSPRYAQEILTPEFGEGLDDLLRANRHKLTGILNGIDTALLDPATDPQLPHPYHGQQLSGKRQNKRRLQQELGLPEAPERPLIGMVTRLADQKGFDLVTEALPQLMAHSAAQLVVLGTGEPRYHDFLKQAMAQYPDRVCARLCFDASLAQRIYAGADFFLMPSRFEPCGLGQLISLRYGTIPVVRATGGLADTIRDVDLEPETGNGFVFEPYQSEAMLEAVQRALRRFQDPAGWLGLVKRAMSFDFSWSQSARQYGALYEEAIARRRRTLAA